MIKGLELAVIVHWIWSSGEHNYDLIKPAIRTVPIYKYLSFLSNHSSFPAPLLVPTWTNSLAWPDRFFAFVCGWIRHFPVTGDSIAQIFYGRVTRSYFSTHPQKKKWWSGHARLLDQAHLSLINTSIRSFTRDYSSTSFTALDFSQNSKILENIVSSHNIIII